jgi:hypothetical protein
LADSNLEGRAPARSKILARQAIDDW